MFLSSTLQAFIQQLTTNIDYVYIWIWTLFNSQLQKYGNVVDDCTKAFRFFQASKAKLGKNFLKRDTGYLPNIFNRDY